jgi:hypothetical protein
MADRRDAVIETLDHERRHVDRGQHAANVDLRDHAHDSEQRARAEGGPAGCRLHRANIEQLHDRVTNVRRITDAEIDRFYELIDDPSFTVSSYPLVSARPPAAFVTRDTRSGRERPRAHRHHA